MKRLLLATAAIETAAGLALLIWPTATVAALLGQAMVPPALTPVRLAGVFLLALGAANGLARLCEKDRAERGLIAGMALYNFGASTGLAVANLGWSMDGFLLWPAVFLHAGMTGWCIAALFGARRTSKESFGGEP